MEDRELYRQILGITAPWSVSRVELDVAQGRVDIWVEHEPGVRWRCPHCERELGVRDHAEERVWRHLDTCQLQTLLHARIPRVGCPEHGVAQVKVPWAETRSRFTLLMERFVIDVLQQCATITGARRILRLSWDEVQGVMQRAVARGLARKRPRPLQAIGVDEKAHRKGHQYLTLVSDHDTGTVEYVAEGRTKESLAGFYTALTSAQRDGLQIVAMDMWEPYVQATREQVPGAETKIVFDRFHIMKHLGEAVDRVRRRENRELTAAGDTTLHKTRYLWLYNAENVPASQRERFARLQRLPWLKSARAWALKESLRPLWRYRRVGWARRLFASWYAWAIRSRLEPMRRVARMIRDRLELVLNFCRHGVSNAVAEGLNSKITAIKSKACGFRSPEAFKTAIYFYCGGLDLYPR
jgi:transposase